VDATASSYSQCPRRGRSTHIDENRTSMKTNITGSPPPAHGYSPNVTPDTPPSSQNQSDAAGDVPLRFAISHRQSALVGVSQHRSQQSPAVTSSHQQSPAVTSISHGVSPLSISITSRASCWLRTVLLVHPQRNCRVFESLV
jgi:hypothetical protein